MKKTRSKIIIKTRAGGCDFVKANYSDSLQNVIMCHLSSENADKDSFIEKMKKVAYGANVDVAERNKEWLLANPNECPF